ncbi:MAG: CheR family methyltransferase [Desulfobaccales bacterium]
MEASANGAVLKAGKDTGLWPQAATVPELTDAEFFRFCRLVHGHAGIHLTSQKRELVRARLSKVLRARSLKSFQEYYELVLADKSGAELAALLDALSTNLTAFWREPVHFQYLAQVIFPSWKGSGKTPLRKNFWSAGCSTGEEAYTLAMLVLDAFAGEDLSRVKIYASDINTQVLAQAERGIYPLSRVEPLPPEWQRRFFQKGMRQHEGFVRVKPEVRQLVHFFRFNLMEPFFFRERMDIIFCRNVMIYFEKQTQAHLVEKFYHCLKPGGYLFIGHSESLCNHRHRFTYVKPTIYRK